MNTSCVQSIILWFKYWFPFDMMKRGSQKKKEKEKKKKREGRGES
jgi:hypothetical protein